MKGYRAFVKKEWMESLRTYRALLLPAVFFLFGMMSPLAAKLMPDIFSGMNMEGVTITVPTPTAIDAYAQLFKNLTQMGIVVLLLVFSGMLSGEIAKGTLIPILTKGLSRNTVILAKYTVSLALWTVSLAVSCASAYGYTSYLFRNAQVEHLLFSVFCLWLFGALLLAFILLAGALVRGGFGGLILTAAFIGILLLANLFPAAEKWNPVSLAAKNMQIIAGTVAVGAMMPAVCLTLAAAVLCLVLSMAVFRKTIL